MADGKLSLGGKLSLDEVMKELQVIKSTQKRYAEQFLNDSANGAACSCFSGQSQQLQDLENASARVITIVEGLAKSLRETQNSLDDLEQYGRRNCLILHGCPDQPVGGKYPVFESYVTNKLNSELDLEYQIRSNDIDICHVLPSRKGRPPPIIIKFVRRSVRNLVFYNKKKLKKSQEKLSITESLTKRRLLLVMEAKKAFGFNNVWTNNGIVYCFYKEKRQVLKDFGDINKLITK